MIKPYSDSTYCEASVLLTHDYGLKSIDIDVSGDQTSCNEPWGSKIKHRDVWCMWLSLQLLIVYFLTLSSLLHFSSLLKCFSYLSLFFCQWYCQYFYIMNDPAGIWRHFTMNRLCACACKYKYALAQLCARAYARWLQLLLACNCSAWYVIDITIIKFSFLMLIRSNTYEQYFYMSVK